jgi:hypothetical protein
VDACRIPSSCNGSNCRVVIIIIIIITTTITTLIIIIITIIIIIIIIITTTTLIVIITILIITTLIIIISLYTPLNWAALYGHLHACRLLVRSATPHFTTASRC